MHPYAKHREHGASHKRVHKIHKHLAKGGHTDEAADRAMISAALRTHENKMHGGKHGDLKVHGHKHGGRLDKYARGGRTKGHHTKVNIVVAPGGPHPAAGAAPAAPVAAPPLIGGGGPMPPPGMGAGMPPRPPGMMKKGGRVKKFARGGPTKPAAIGKGYTAGAETGPGRIQKARKYKARG